MGKHTCIRLCSRQRHADAGHMF